VTVLTLCLVEFTRIIPNTKPSKPAASVSSSSVASTRSATSADVSGASAAAAEASAPVASGDDKDSDDVASTSDSYVSISLSARSANHLDVKPARVYIASYETCMQT
jgi:hypothetical protein